MDKVKADQRYLKDWFQQEHMMPAQIFVRKFNESSLQADACWC